MASLPNPHAVGILLIVVGAPYALWARQIRDWQVRSLQGGSYLTFMRLSGIAMCLAGLAILIWGVIR